MSANPATNDAVTLNGGCTVADPGGKSTGSQTECVEESSYNSNNAARFSSSSQARINGLNNATTFTDRSLAVFANTQQGVVLKDKAGVTWGLKNSYFAEKVKPIQIGGAVVDASKAKKVVVTLSDNKLNNAKTKTAPSRFIPKEVRETLQTGKFNTITVLSKGADQYTGTTAKDFASLGKGKDRANMGKGKDLVVMSDKLKTKRIDLGGGKDRALLDEGALKKKGKAKIYDFNNKKDTLILETKASKVSGIDSDTLKISTKNGTVKVISKNDTFSRSSLDFIG